MLCLPSQPLLRYCRCCTRAFSTTTMPHSAFLLFSPLLKSTMISYTTLQKKHITARCSPASESPHSPSELHAPWPDLCPWEVGYNCWMGAKQPYVVGPHKHNAAPDIPIHQGSLHQSSSPNHQATCLQRTGPQPVPSVTFSQRCGTVGGFPQSLGLSPSFFQCFSEVMKIINAYYAEALLHSCSLLLHLPKAMSSLQNRKAGTMLSHR